jgi:hypothetical protein
MIGAKGGEFIDQQNDCQLLQVVTVVGYSRSWLVILFDEVLSGYQPGQMVGKRTFRGPSLSASALQYVLLLWYLVKYRDNCTVPP